VMTSRGGLESGPPKPPLMQSCLKTRASGALNGSQSDENSELPKCVSYSEKPSRFVVGHQECQATKKSPIYIHVLGGRRQATLGTGLLGRRPGFPKGERGPRGRDGQRLWSLLGTFLSLVVRSHACGRRLLKRTGGRLACRSEAFQPSFINQGRAHVKERRGRPSCPLICLLLTGGCRFSKGPRHPFPRRPTGGTPISLSLSSRDCATPLEARLVAHPVGHPWRNQHPACHHSYS
jgi:hypothetical protein